MNKVLVTILCFMLILTACGKPSTTGAVGGVETEETPQAEKVRLDLYAMSQCPYGVEAEKALIPINEPI